MPKTLRLYVDDSGSRNPDTPTATHKAGGDCFALGGIIINEANADASNAAIDDFVAQWPRIGGAPLHSYEIRNRTGGFGWLKTAKPALLDKFMEDLGELIAALPIYALACVVDRPGYSARYIPEYGPRRWMLCKTAFSILLERAAKYALHEEARLRVHVERSDPKAEEHLREYYDTLRANGAPFSAATSAVYAPLTAEQFAATLYEFRIKTKESRLMQIADLVLWPLCQRGYDPAYKPYLLLQSRGRLLESICTPENKLLGTKYSCF